MDYRLASAKNFPLTVTDAKVTRFFMTVPEAVQLILQASSMAKGGEITGLKSGEKMDEELVEDHADLKESEHPSIMVLREAEVRDLEKDIMNLEILSRTAPSKTLVELLNELVPSFTPALPHAKGAGDA